ncbi:DUF1398 domain-containing protein [Taibaiella koreensis]|uniref:DUF1398 domain-containing protein n=1 Tax=Taibaiella koreensis TaxID=1268548 RepID=UPI000E59BA57|nr:DUF1398 family protein [Taibaiella koreensis]
MFTIDQIYAAHSKVRSGADFPQYIRDLRQLGITGYRTYVADGHTDYHDAEGYKASSEPKYNALSIAGTSDAIQFAADLKAHQQGKTDYPTFCKDCARSGIEKWIVSMDQMTCIYYDKTGQEILAEAIPA